MDTKASPSKIDFSRYFLRSSIFDHFSEGEFYRLLKDEILGKRFVAFAQFPLSSLVDVRGKSEPGGWSLYRRVAEKRIDFLICDVADLKPALAVELDGSSHSKPSRQARDQLLEKVFAAIGLPLIRVPVKTRYNKAAIALSIAKKLNLEERVIKRLEAQSKAANI